MRECVRGKLTRFYIIRHFGRFFSSKSLFITFEVLGCYFVSILHEKCARKHIFTPVNSSVNTLLLAHAFLLKNDIIEHMNTKIALLVHGYNGVPKIYEYFQKELKRNGYKVIIP